MENNLNSDASLKGNPSTSNENSAPKEIKLTSGQISSDKKEDEASSKDLLSRPFSMETAFTILVNPKQKGNKVLSYIRETPWEYSDIVPDYLMGKNTCALFLSLRYHNLYPDYIHHRLKLLGKGYSHRILLVHVDAADPNAALMELNVICVLVDFSLVLAWSDEEAAKCLESFKIYQNKSAEALMKRPDETIYLQIVESLTMIKSVNKTDADSLLDTFGNFDRIAEASAEELALCPGIGMLKARRIFEAMRQPFILDKT